MPRVSSGSIFSAHLNLARQIIAGAIQKDDAQLASELLCQSHGKDASSTLVSSALSVLADDWTPTSRQNHLNFDEFRSVMIKPHCSLETVCVANFDLQAARRSIGDEIWSALDTGHVWNYEISEDVWERLSMAKSRPSLSGHLHQSALDHLVSDIGMLLDELPGTAPAQGVSRIWSGSVKGSDVTPAISWIREAKLTKFVSSLIIYSPERTSDNDN